MAFSGFSGDDRPGWGECRGLQRPRAAGLSHDPWLAVRASSRSGVSFFSWVLTGFARDKCGFNVIQDDYFEDDLK